VKKLRLPAFTVLAVGVLISGFLGQAAANAAIPKTAPGAEKYSASNLQNMSGIGSFLPIEPPVTNNAQPAMGKAGTSDIVYTFTLVAAQSGRARVEINPEAVFSISSETIPTGWVRLPGSSDPNSHLYETTGTGLSMGSKVTFSVKMSATSNVSAWMAGIMHCVTGTLTFSTGMTAPARQAACVFPI